MLYVLSYMIVLLLLLLLLKNRSFLKTIISYFFIVIFTITCCYKSVKYLISAKVDVVYVSDMDCENEKEDSREKDEIVDPFCHLLLYSDRFILTEEIFLPTELIVNFSSTDYCNLVYSPPEVLS